MPIRLPLVAGAFYPQQATACREKIAYYLGQAEPPLFDKPLCAGLVPHAGWVYSAGTAAYLYAALAQREPPEVVVLLGAVHRWGVDQPAVYPAGAWRTPLGDAQVDAELGSALVRIAAGKVISSAQAHDDEHSIEVQVPFIQYLLPNAPILPIAVPPEAGAVELGSYLATAGEQLNRRMVVIASSDLTHYGPQYRFTPAGVGARGLEWTRGNDAQLLERAAQMQAQEVLAFAASNRSACGAGAIAAAISYARQAGAERGFLLHYTTSFDVQPSGQPTSLVGYGAMAFI